MNDNKFEVPTIDISCYRSADAYSDSVRAAVATELDRICREVGFVQVVGHGIDDAVLSDLGDALDEFFALPLAVKKEYRREAWTNRGYSAPK